ncbi:uncharacterized protein LOC123228997 [Mangifera indica]|uniref:uncharacterized protein LOC123228997 n=1 Tax=Mangifera indica TaxID=29780 RepID=UPI001CF9D4D8|nr:uncharacterized protein LOC123228997 [Mangifera indica]XP_044510474.1 uncharacterized protein LOC123228997 [Mangifera indica]
MNTLWVNWRSCLNAKYVKPCKTVAEALKNKPEGMEKEDWEWLTKHFFTKDFQKISSQASQNRAKSSMPHRTGSKPHRQIIYDMGGKEGNPPDMGILFFETRKKDGKLVEPETEEKHLQIVKTIQAEPTLSIIEVIEKCFGAQHHSNVFGYGGGIKRKNFKDPRQKKMDELQAKLHNKDEENRILKRHIAKIEERLLRIEHFMQQNPNVSTEFPLSELDQELHKNDV